MSYNEIGFSAVFLITDQEMQTTKKNTRVSWQVTNSGTHGSINHTQTHLLATKISTVARFFYLSLGLERSPLACAVTATKPCPVPRELPRLPSPKGLRAVSGGSQALGEDRPREAAEARAAVQDPITLGGEMELSVPATRGGAKGQPSISSRRGDRGSNHGNPGRGELRYGNRGGAQSRPFVSGDPGTNGRALRDRPRPISSRLRALRGRAHEGAGPGEPWSAAGGGRRVPSGVSSQPGCGSAEGPAGGVGPDPGGLRDAPGRRGSRPEVRRAGPRRGRVRAAWRCRRRHLAAGAQRGQAGAARRTPGAGQAGSGIPAFLPSPLPGSHFPGLVTRLLQPGS